MIEEWITEHEEKLKIASLAVAFLVLFVSVYRWLLQKWRADVSLRKYAYLRPLATSDLNAKQVLVVEVPVDQKITLILSKGDTIKEVLYDGMAVVGDLEIDLDMSTHEKGDYELSMKTNDQSIIKRMTWSA